MLDSRVIENIDRFVEAELSCRSHSGSSVSIIRGGEVAWSKGFGYANVDEKEHAEAETVYRCASVTKPVVTVGLLQLMEKGKFSLDDEANSHLDVKIRDVQGDEPTIRDLLTHRSGMPTRVPPIYMLDEEPLTMKGYIESAARAVRPRGEAWAYCNTAYMIAGYLIELFSGKTYDKYVTEKVLQPLEMKSSTFTLTPEISGKLAQGYKRAGGPDKPLIPVSPYLLGTMPEDPAGSLYSTVLDLANFVIMNMNGGSFKGRRILKEETIEEMHRLQAPSGNSRSGMGLTWFYSIHDGHVMLSHTGGLPDFTNNVCFYPEKKAGVCWLSNLQDGSGWRPPSPTILRIVVEEKPRFSETLQTVPGNWDKICGVYGDETRQVALGMRNGFLTMNNMVLLERIDDARYIAHGPSNDGYEVTIDYGEDEQAKSISFGTTSLPRYTPEKPVIDTSLELEGTWKGEYYNSSGFHTLELNIKDETHGTVRDPQEESMVLDEFKATEGKVTGAFKYIFPKEFARWGTSDYTDVILELTAVSGQLKGVLRSRGMATRITLERTN
ncbi:MAG: beta-lactamase family protein [Candidatus Bathyarchaeota archaeon]|nr:beta-lactamase family protein [Candidatus Bathyarchaeota archaeon]